MKRSIKRGLLIVAIILLAVAGAGVLGQMKPPPEKSTVEALDPLVEVFPLKTEIISFQINSQGTVRPRTQTVLSAEISGAIVEVSPKFVAGGVFAAGEVLMRIDPTNYRAALEQAEALLEQRRVEYDGAKKLRIQGYRAEADLAAAAAAQALARAELVRAQRNLERTELSLPYAGMVIAKDADVGQFVGVGTRLGQTFATDYAEVRLPISDEELAFVDLPLAAQIAATGAAEGPLVTLSAQRRGEAGLWPARITRSEGVIDELTRVTYAVARVDDPYRLKADAADGPLLPIGAFVTARIEGATVAGVIRVPRSAVRGNGQIIVVDDASRIQIRAVTILRADASFAYLVGGVRAGEQLVLTVLENPIDGMLVRITETPEALSAATPAAGVLK